MTSKNLAKRLRHRRISLGLSQGTIAHRAGINAVYVSNFELEKSTNHAAAIRRVLIEAGLQNRTWRKAEKESAFRRSILAAVPHSPEKDILQAAMLARASHFLALGRAEEADAILDFLPAEAVERLLNYFFRED